MARRFQPSLEQRKAYNQVRMARNRGDLIAPRYCERCKEPTRFGTDGRCLLHAHHADYSKPLDVEWMCVKCHRKETRLPIGESNGKAVLKATLVQAARLLHKEGFAIVDIAEFLQVNPHTLGDAIHGNRWGHVE